MKTLALIAAYLALPLALIAQTTSSTASVSQQAAGPANVAGILYASNFAHWTATPTPSGNRWDDPGQCFVTSGQLTLPTFSTGAPVTIVDLNNSANTETVTPSLVSYLGSGCSVSLPATHPHLNYYLKSGTVGLQDALNWAGTSRAVVVLTPDWVTMGGTTAMITAATAGTNTTILDMRTSTLAAYAGTTPALVSASTATFAGVPPGAGCTVGQIATNTAATSSSTVLFVCYPAGTYVAVTVP